MVLKNIDQNKNSQIDGKELHDALVNWFFDNPENISQIKKQLYNYTEILAQSLKKILEQKYNEINKKEVENRNDQEIIWLYNKLLVPTMPINMDSNGHLNNKVMGTENRDKLENIKPNLSNLEHNYHIQFKKIIDRAKNKYVSEYTILRQNIQKKYAQKNSTEIQDYMKYESIIWAAWKYYEELEKDNNQLLKKHGFYEQMQIEDQIGRKQEGEVFWWREFFACGELFQFLDNIQYPWYTKDQEIVQTYNTKTEQILKNRWYLGNNKFAEHGGIYQKFEQEINKKIKETNYNESIQYLAQHPEPKDESENSVNEYMDHVENTMVYSQEYENISKKYGPKLLEGYINTVQDISTLQNQYPWFIQAMTRMADYNQKIEKKKKELNINNNTIDRYIQYNTQASQSIYPLQQRCWLLIQKVQEEIQWDTTNSFIFPAIKKQLQEQKEKQDKTDGIWSTIKTINPGLYSQLNFITWARNGLIDATVWVGTWLWVLITSIWRDENQTVANIDRAKTWNNFFKIGQSAVQLEPPVKDGKRNLSFDNGTAQIGAQVSNMLVLLSGAGMVGRWVTMWWAKVGLHMTQKVGTRSWLFSWASMQWLPNTFQQYLGEWIDKSTAWKYALWATILWSSLEMIAPNDMFFWNLGIKKIIQQLGKEQAAKIIAKEFSKNMGKEIGEEIAQESLQLSVERIINKNINEAHNTNLETSLTRSDFWTTALLTALTTGIVSSRWSLQAAKSTINHPKTIAWIAQDPKRYEDYIGKLNNIINGKVDIWIEIEQAKTLLEEIHKTSEWIKQVKTEDLKDTKIDTDQNHSKEEELLKNMKDISFKNKKEFIQNEWYKKIKELNYGEKLQLFNKIKDIQLDDGSNKFDHFMWDKDVQYKEQYNQLKELWFNDIEIFTVYRYTWSGFAEINKYNRWTEQTTPLSGERMMYCSLFSDIFDVVLEKLSKRQEFQPGNNVFQRYLSISSTEIDWYLKSLEEGQLQTNFISTRNSEIKNKKNNGDENYTVILDISWDTSWWVVIDAIWTQKWKLATGNKKWENEVIFPRGKKMKATSIQKTSDNTYYIKVEFVKEFFDLWYLGQTYKEIWTIEKEIDINRDVSKDWVVSDTKDVTNSQESETLPRIPKDVEKAFYPRDLVDLDPKVSAKKLLDNVILPMIKLWSVAKIKEIESILMQRIGSRLLHGTWVSATDLFQQMTWRDFEEVTTRKNRNTREDERMSAIRQGCILLPESIEIIKAEIESLLQTDVYLAVRDKIEIDRWSNDISLHHVAEDKWGQPLLSRFWFINITLKETNEVVGVWLITIDPQISLVWSQQQKQYDKVLQELNSMNQMMNHDWYHNLTLLLNSWGILPNSIGTNNTTIAHAVELEYNAAKFHTDYWNKIFELKPSLKESMIKKFIEYIWKVDTLVETIKPEWAITKETIREYLLTMYGFWFFRVIDYSSDPRLQGIVDQNPRIIDMKTDSWGSEQHFQEQIHKNSYALKQEDWKEFTHQEVFEDARPRTAEEQKIIDNTQKAFLESEEYRLSDAINDIETSFLGDIDNRQTRKELAIWLAKMWIESHADLKNTIYNYNEKNMKQFDPDTDSLLVIKEYAPHLSKDFFIELRKIENVRLNDVAEYLERWWTNFAGDILTNIK